MLGLAEYRVFTVELFQLGREIEDKIQKGLVEGLTKSQTIALANSYVEDYTRRYRSLLDERLREIGVNAGKYYNKKLGLSEDVDAIVKSLVDKQYREKYYQATLNARLLVNEKRLRRRIVQSGQIGPQALTKVFTSSVPFGSQLAVDQRVFLGSAVKVEQDVAKVFAEKSESPLIRWTLSHRHTQPDACDDYASTVNKSVVTYLEENKIDTSPKGLFFIKDLPLPPHPNCQCEYGMVSTEKETKPGKVQRSLKKLRQILRKLRGK